MSTGPMSMSRPSSNPDHPVGPLLSVRELVSEFSSEHSVVRAVDGVSFELEHGEVLGVVGESGSGKSATALSILGLLPRPHGRIVSGSIRFFGRELVGLKEPELRALRGARIAMIFQDPMSSLNPVHTVGTQVAEASRAHRPLSKRAARAEALALFRRVGIADPERRLDAYPHELSGGMRQRVMIAIAVANRPALLIADEPTTALDVTIQAQILELLARLQRELGMSILLITHDLGVVAETCDEVVVMYAGRVVERAKTETLFAAPRHHYTAGLLRSVPSYGDGTAVAEHARLQEIRGMVPALSELPPGCKFAERCPAVAERCRAEEPPLVALGASRVRCHFPLDPPVGMASEAAP